MTFSTVLGAPLTSNDLKALRGADRVGFSRHSDGTAWIRCVKEVKKAGPYEDRERVYEIQVSSTVTLYNEDGDYSDRRGREQRAQCHTLLYYHNPLFKTVAGLLRTGDQLTLCWCGANQNTYLQRTAAGPDGPVYRDELHLEVRRKGKTLRFLLDVSLCPNNTARMIRA